MLPNTCHPTSTRVLVVHISNMILPKTGTTVALGIALLAGSEALPEPAAVRRQEVSGASSGK